MRRALARRFASQVIGKRTKTIRFWQCGAPLKMLAGLLEQDHALLGDLLQRLECALQRRDLFRGFALLDLFWAQLATHIRAENVCLFPAILNARPEVFGQALPPFAEVEKTIERLRADHSFFMDQLSKAVKAMRQFLISSGTYTQWKRTRELNSIRERIQAVSSRLKDHNRLEEENVYEWPAAMLGAADLEKLYEVLKHESETLPPRFSGSHISARTLVASPD